MKRKTLARAQQAAQLDPADRQQQERAQRHAHRAAEHRDFGLKTRAVQSLLRQHDQVDTWDAAKEWMRALEEDPVLVHQWLAAGWTDARCAEDAMLGAGRPEEAAAALAHGGFTVAQACDPRARGQDDTLFTPEWYEQHLTSGWH